MLVKKQPTSISLMQRETTTTADKLRFKHMFMIELRTRLDDPAIVKDDITDKNLCEIYESLPASKKRGIWPIVDAGMKKPLTWAAKHYLNCFKRALFPGQLTQNVKQKIQDFLLDPRRRVNMGRRAIVEHIKQMIADHHIFPNAIESYVFQEMKRISTNNIRPRRIIKEVSYEDYESYEESSETDAKDAKVKTEPQQRKKKSIYNVLTAVNPRQHQQQTCQLNPQELREYAKCVQGNDFEGFMKIMCRGMLESFVKAK